jgi:hypothetical protein
MDHFGAAVGGHVKIGVRVGEEQGAKGGPSRSRGAARAQCHVSSAAAAVTLPQKISH